MAFIHGKGTVFKLNGVDLSAYCKTSEVTNEADEHDVTGYGAQGHAVQGGLIAAKVSVSGTYGTGATGPRGVIVPLIGTTVAFIRQPEGTGAGKPQDTATVHVKSYVETNPVADMIAWSAELTVSGVINSAPQP
jgi:hypothetical protein